MKLESVVLAVSGAFFGLIVGWVLGSQQGAPATVAPAAAGESQQAAATPVVKAVDERQVQALRVVIDGDPTNVTARTQLGNLYFDAERYDQAATWYEEALKLSPRDVNVSTDLGVSYYYLNQADRALKQFDYSLGVDPGHAKTLLNLGVVRAFGKQDLKGAAAVWQQLIQMAPDSEEAQAARRALDSLRSAHPGLDSSTGGAPPPTDE